MLTIFNNKSTFSYATQLIMVGGVAFLLNGCARDISPNSYSESAVGETSHTFKGKILSVRTVRVAPENLEGNIAGAGIGGLTGGVIGNQFGSGGGNLATTVGGAIAGGLIGAFAEKELKTQDAYEYIIELRNGEMRTVVQGMDVKYSPGQEILLIISHKGRSRIVPNNLGY